MRPGGRRDGAPRKQKLGQRRGAREAQIQREILRGKDQPLQQRRRFADLVQVGDRFGGFDEREDRERRPGGRSWRGFAEGVRDHVVDEGQVGGRVDFGDHEGGEVWGLELFVFLPSTSFHML